MDAQQYYAGLRTEDRERVEAVVAALKSSGLQVYANFFMSYLIPDSEIGLSVTPNKGMTRGDIQHSVDDVVKQFHGQIVREAVPESPRGRMFPESYVIKDEPQSFTPSEMDALKKACEKYFIKPGTPEKGFDYRKELDPFIIRSEKNNLIKYFKRDEFNLPSDLFLPRLERKNPYNANANPDDFRIPLSKRINYSLEGLTKTSFEKEFTLTDGMPEYIRSPKDMARPVPPEQPAMVREQRYRIGTIGETPIEVRVSYQPIDALSKLIKVEL